MVKVVRRVMAFTVTYSSYAADSCAGVSRIVSRARRETMVTPQELLAFMRQHRVGVQASVAGGVAPQAAVVGIAVTDRFEIIFDTTTSTRKLQNLRRNPRIAFVVGGPAEGDVRTVQYEGVADEPFDAELARVKSVYYQVYPDG